MSPIPCDLVCLGEPLVEFNEVEPGSFRRGFGGDVSNVAIRAARAGARSAMLCALGEDRFGDDLVALWQSEGVGTAYLDREPSAATGIYFVTHDVGGHSFHYYRAGSAMARAERLSGLEAALASCRILHLSGISLAISARAREIAHEAVGLARAAGALISLDTNYRPALWPVEAATREIEGLLASVDILLPSLEDAELLTGLTDPFEIVTQYQSRGPGIVALTRGAAGVIVCDRDAGLAATAIPAETITPVDATGAGDAFDGAFLAGLLAGQDTLSAARTANAAAARATQGFGALG